MIDTPEGINAYHLLAQRGAMKLEILGMKHSSGRSICTHVKKQYGFKGNKAAVLAQFESYLREEGILS